MKILLIGHSIIDNLENSSAKTPGGVFYSTLGLLSSFTPNDQVHLLTSWDEENIEIFAPLYTKVDLTLSEKVKNMPEVILDTSGSNERREVYKNISEPLNVNSLKDLEQYDGILINMITGFDITIEQLKRIRENYKGIIFFDVHTLSRGLGQYGKREFRRIPNVEEWLNCVDILQCNESELNTIQSNENEEEKATWILGKGVKILLITKAQNGAVLYCAESKSKIEIPGEKIDLKNKIGCGDIFGASFFYSYIFTNDKKKSITYANHAGAIAASTKNLYTYTKLLL